VDRGAVGGARHQPIKHVELAHQMAFANATDGWVARHLPDILGAKGQETNPRTAARGGSRCLAAGMAGANHHNVVHSRLLADQCFT